MTTPTTPPTECTCGAPLRVAPAWVKPSHAQALLALADGEVRVPFRVPIREVTGVSGHVFNTLERRGLVARADTREGAVRGWDILLSLTPAGRAAVRRLAA